MSAGITQGHCAGAAIRANLGKKTQESFAPTASRSGNGGRKVNGMRNKLAVAAGGLILGVALAIPSGAQASVGHSGSAHTNAAATSGLSLQGCGNLWNIGPLANGDDGQYGFINDFTGYPANTLFFAPGVDFSSVQIPTFCNLSITSVNGAFEIMDPSDANSTHTQWGCLAVNLTTDTVGDDTPSACWGHVYTWDQWNAINTHTTYHSNTLWEFENKDVPGQCLTVVGYNSGYAAYRTCGEYPAYQYFAWPGSAL